MTYQRKTFNTEAFAVYEGDVFIKNFRYHKVAKRFIAKQPNSDMFTIKVVRNEEAASSTV